MCVNPFSSFLFQRPTDLVGTPTTMPAPSPGLPLSAASLNAPPFHPTGLPPGLAAAAAATLSPKRSFPNPPPNMPSASSPGPAPTGKGKSTVSKVLQHLISLVNERYPTMKEEEVLDVIQQLKQTNNGTLKGLTMNDCLKIVATLITPGKF